MSGLILCTSEDGTSHTQLRTDAVVKSSLTTAASSKNHRTHFRTFGLHREATVKECLTVQSRGNAQATAEESSAVQPAGTSQARLGQ